MNAEQYDAMMLETARTALAFAREENWRGVHETLLACGGASSTTAATCFAPATRSSTSTTPALTEPTGPREGPVLGLGDGAEHHAHRPRP